MNIFKNGAKLAGSLIMAAVISIFLCISMVVIFSALFTKETGYTAYVYADENVEELITEYEYLYTDTDGDGKDDGDDVKKKEYEEQNYIVITSPMRSELTGVSSAIFLITTQIFTIVMVVAFASNSSYKQGFKDSNLVKIGHIKQDTLKGLKIGLIGNIPFFAMFILLIIMSIWLAPNFRTVWYAYFNGFYYPLYVWIVGGVKVLSEQVISQLSLVDYILMFALQLIVPLISTAAYILGYKEINLSEKIMYKKEGK